MPYEHVLPNDTVCEIETFIESNFTGFDAENAALTAIDDELALIFDNPLIGTLTRKVGPWSRRYRDWTLRVERFTGRMRFTYQDRLAPAVVVVYGFEGRRVQVY